MKTKPPVPDARDPLSRPSTVPPKDAARDRAAGPPPKASPGGERAYEDRQDAAFDPRGDSAPAPDTDPTPGRSSTPRR